MPGVHFLTSCLLGKYIFLERARCFCLSGMYIIQTKPLMCYHFDLFVVQQHGAVLCTKTAADGSEIQREAEDRHCRHAGL